MKEITPLLLQVGENRQTYKKSLSILKQATDYLHKLHFECERLIKTHTETTHTKGMPLLPKYQVNGHARNPSLDTHNTERKEPVHVKCLLFLSFPQLHPGSLVPLPLGALAAVRTLQSQLQSYSKSQVLSVSRSSTLVSSVSKKNISNLFHSYS